MASYYFDSDEESLNLINEVDNVDIGLYFLNKNDSDELLENNDGEFSVLEGGYLLNTLYSSCGHNHGQVSLRQRCRQRSFSWQNHLSIYHPAHFR